MSHEHEIDEEAAERAFNQNWLNVPSADGGYYSIPLHEVGAFLDIMQEHRQGEEEPLDTLRRMRQDILRFEQWVADLQSGMFINCVYCGHRYGPAESTPVAMSTLLTKHIETCSKHPLSHAKTAIANYQRIVNYWFPKLGYPQANDMAYPALGDRRAYPSPVLAWAEEHAAEALRPLYEKVAAALDESGAGEKVAAALGLQYEKPAGQPVGNTGMVVTPMPADMKEPLLGFVIALLIDYVPKALQTKGWFDVKEDLRAMALKHGLSPEAVLAWAEAGLPRDFKTLKK